MIKTLILTLLLVASFSQSITLEEAIGYVNSNQVFDKGGYLDIPVDNLEEPYTFIKEIIEYTYVKLENWTLVDIRSKSEESTNQTIYIYTYFEIYQDEDGNSSISDMGVVTVIQHQDILFTIFQGSTPIRTFDFQAKNYWDHQPEKAAESKKDDKTEAPLAKQGQKAAETGETTEKTVEKKEQGDKKENQAGKTAN